MHIEEREIGVVELTTEELDAVSGGRLSFEMVGAFRTGLILGFCGAGGFTAPGPNGAVDFIAGGHVVHF
jgi:hypothetical protein